jgi:hypothetical protein
VLLALSAVATPAVADTDRDNDSRRLMARETVAISDARLKFEINATALDGGIQIFLDADPWQTMNIYDPRGRLVFASATVGSIGANGGTELFLESGEPAFTELPLDELLERFPAGAHPLASGVRVDPNNAVLMWERVPAPNGSPIVGYQVLVVRTNTDIRALPKITLDVMMPPTATSMTVPVGFLERDTVYEWEILAIESSGNQTLSSSFFTTSP